MSRPGGIYWSSVGVVLRPQPAVGPALHSHLDHEGRQLFPVHRSIVVHVYLCGRSSYGNGRGAPSRRKSGFFCPKAVLVPPSLFRFEILCEELICVARKDKQTRIFKEGISCLSYSICHFFEKIRASSVSACISLERSISDIVVA